MQDARADGYEDSLKNRVKRAVDPTGRDGTQAEVDEEKIDIQVNTVKLLNKGHPFLQASPDGLDLVKNNACIVVILANSNINKVNRYIC